jgi:hypothetical protein
MSYFGEEFKEYDRLPISIIDEAKIRLIKKGVNEGDYKNEENQIVIKDVLDRLLTSYEKRVIRARKSAQKSRDKKKAEKAKENEPTLSTELIADPPTESKMDEQDEPHTEVETQVEKQVQKPIQKIQMEFQRKKEEPKKRHIWFS